MAAPLPRRLLGVMIAALAAGPAAAGEGRGMFTVSATVVRAAAVRVEARPAPGEGVRIEASVSGRGAAGVVVSRAGEPGVARAAAAPLSADIAARPGVVMVTVLPDGRPTSLRLRD
jgi:hypothetical protein